MTRDVQNQSVIKIHPVNIHSVKSKNQIKILESGAESWRKTFSQPGA